MKLQTVIKLQTKKQQTNDENMEHIVMVNVTKDL